MTFGSVVTPSPDLDDHLAVRYCEQAAAARAASRADLDNQRTKWATATVGNYHRNGSGNGCGFEASIVEDALVIEWHDGTDDGEGPNGRVAVPMVDLNTALEADRVADGALVAAARTFGGDGVTNPVAVIRERCTTIATRGREEHHGRMLVVAADTVRLHGPDRIAVLDLHLVVAEADVSSWTNGWRPEMWGAWLSALSRNDLDL